MRIVGLLFVILFAACSGENEATKQAAAPADPGTPQSAPAASGQPRPGNESGDTTGP